MNSPVPSITDDQLDDIAVKRRADLMVTHDQYAQQLDVIRRRDIACLQQIITDLLNIIETGLPNHGVIERARRIAREI